MELDSYSTQRLQEKVALDHGAKSSTTCRQSVYVCVVEVVEASIFSSRADSATFSFNHENSGRACYVPCMDLTSYVLYPVHKDTLQHHLMNYFKPLFRRGVFFRRGLF